MSGSPRSPSRDALRAWDLDHVWHPYTQMREYERDHAAGHVPIIVGAQGRKLIDVDGREWWDATGSMWLNVHGHRVPEIDAAITAQLGKVAHSTLLGQASEPSILLARRLAQHAGLPHVFFSDNGSTAVESAIKIALQFWHLEHGASNRKTRIASFDGAYHGDTLGAIAAAPVPEFHAAFAAVLPQAPIRLPWPDARKMSAEVSRPLSGDSDVVAWGLAEADAILSRHAHELAAVVVEPMVQFVGGLRIMPRGYLAGLRKLCTQHDVLLIFDEVATGFGRTGRMFAGDHEDVRPDLLALGKGITGGYLPLAATLATNEIYDAFLGDYADMRAFYHGHSYSGNQLACAAALANLDLLEPMLPSLPEKAAWLAKELESLRGLPFVGDVRSLGFAAGIDLVMDQTSRHAFPWASRAGWAVYKEALARGMIARPYASTALFVPPIATPHSELRAMLDIYCDAIVAAEGKLASLARQAWPDIEEVPR